VHIECWFPGFIAWLGQFSCDIHLNFDLQWLASNPGDMSFRILFCLSRNVCWSPS